MKAFCLALLLAAAALPLFARDVEIILSDTELGLPLEGAVIRSWDGRQYTCDENGRALVSVPDDRQVVVQAAYPGYENGRLLVTLSGGVFTLGLRLSGVMENRELVVEAARPGTSETRTGRSVAVSGRDIAQTAEIGIIEDVMSSVKLLPGVGYAGFFNAQPSIRGGEPGDMSAALDGFYIHNPYHWDGGYSIFDPRMVQSAQLSHGVFSSRYGHTISGLLEISSKNPSPSEIEFELGASTSAASFNLSFPLAGRGGVLAMGRVTYYDPVVDLAKGLSKSIDAMAHINAIKTAPYIRSGAVTGSYRFFDNLELHATGFWGMDGVGLQFHPDAIQGLTSRMRILLDYTNYQGFLTAGLSWNPRNDMLIKFSAGTGYEDTVADGYMENSIGDKPYSQGFRDKYEDIDPFLSDAYNFYNKSTIDQSDFLYNAQGRIDFDWEAVSGFIFAAGIQEMFSEYRVRGLQQALYEVRFSSFSDGEQEQLKNLLALYGVALPDDSSVWRDLRISFPVTYRPSAGNKLLSTAAYTLGEYATPDERLKAELGLRLDHFYLMGEGFALQSKPALNPRLNIDFNVFKGRGIFQSLDLSAGTGLFSSVNSNVYVTEAQYSIEEIKPNRSWTSVLGARVEFPFSLTLNIEGYCKYIFDRMYVPVDFGLEDLDVRPQFDGEGRVWGIDLMLQKLQSRFWDGWISYSFSWAQYRDPSSGAANMGISGGANGDDWYFPSYHRFHNLNLVLNVRPAPRFNIYARFGIASGVQILRRVTERPESYPALVYDPEHPEDAYFIEKYRWPSVQDPARRTTPTLPLDIKFSLFGGRANGKSLWEWYFAIENALALLYTSTGNTSYNPYTGEESPEPAASYDLPIPLPSFGFKMSY